MSFHLLSLDGGGIRGYMTARILEELQKETGLNPTTPQVSGLAGTSTGGLLAIAFAAGKTPAEMANLYRHRAPEIFQPNRPFVVNRMLRMAVRVMNAISPALSMEKLLEIEGFFETRYVADGLSKVIKEIVGTDSFGDIDPSRVLVVNAAALKVPDSGRGWRSATMTNQDIKVPTLGDTRAISLRDGALSTSAAPSYFPPNRVRNGTRDLGWFADGGLYANNPVMNGIETALAAKKTKLDNIKAISIGTGLSTEGISADAITDPKEMGLAAWLGAHKGVPFPALLTISLTCSANNQDNIAQSILGDRMVRLNPVTSRPVDLDGISSEDFEVMDDAVTNLMSKPEWQSALTMAASWV